jgi:heterodisulfide reductase subunit B
VSEVFWALRERIRERAKYTLDGIRVAVHYGDHYWKGIMHNAIGGYRPHILEDFLQALGATVVPYSAYYDCCGFGFRHIIMNRTMTRSQVFKKLRSIRDEAKADLIVTNCPGCGNTLDKNQWIQKAREHCEEFSIPVLFPYQVASLCMGADPYKVACIHFNATPVEPLLEKMGIPYDKDFYERFKEEEVAQPTEGKKVIDGVDVSGVWSQFLPPRWIEVK